MGIEWLGRIADIDSRRRCTKVDGAVVPRTELSAVEHEC